MKHNQLNLTMKLCKLQKKNSGKFLDIFALAMLAAVVSIYSNYLFT